ncbi:hypothetical protein AGLY_004303 [Aphis glycines]|uniref:Uncharacterized protein n=1 Tax=Aphis glycines TaxID=307491 RepID=A0A6G0TY32_APHGL|nr:hypothetical protein AGLY_004303 [Aphis glycines]
MYSSELYLILAENADRRKRGKSVNKLAAAEIWERTVLPTDKTLQFPRRHSPARRAGNVVVPHEDVIDTASSRFLHVTRTRPTIGSAVIPCSHTRAHVRTHTSERLHVQTHTVRPRRHLMAKVRLFVLGRLSFVARRLFFVVFNRFPFSGSSFHPKMSLSLPSAFRSSPFRSSVR